jgi:hypothetical protein
MTTKAKVLRSIREKCLDCSVQQPGEVKSCTVYTCALHPFRFGVDPDPSTNRGFAKSRVYASKSEDQADD